MNTLLARLVLRWIPCNTLIQRLLDDERKMLKRHSVEVEDLRIEVNYWRDLYLDEHLSGRQEVI